MAVPTVEVTIRVRDADGVALLAAAVRAMLNTSDRYQGQIIPRIEVIGVTDAGGECVLDIFPNELGEVTGDYCGDGSDRHTAYKFTVRHPTTGKKLYETTAFVPNQAVNLVDIAGNVCSTLSVAGQVSSLGVSFADDETPAGVVNGVNRVFTLAHAPTPSASLELSVNGLRYKEGVNYELVDDTITFAVGFAPQVGDTMSASYRY